MLIAKMMTKPQVSNAYMLVKKLKVKKVDVIPGIPDYHSLEN